MPKPDLQKFLTDPAFQQDRDFLGGVFNHFLTEAQKKAEEERKKKEAEEGGSIFDSLFGGK